jgi:hypothetical protein
MNWEAIALALGAAVFSHSLQFRVGKYRVSASLAGTPTHLTFSQALQGAEAALLGQAGTFQSGDVVITVDLWPPT